MMNFQNISREEADSALFDGENLPEHVELTDETREHMQNWSLIGATLRSEVPSDIKPDFSASVMARIADERIVPDTVDQAKVQKLASVKFKNMFRKVSFGLTQIAVAASVAAVTVIGYQTYNAEDEVSTEFPVSGAIGSANLASYSTSAQGSKEISFDNRAISAASDRKVDSEELKKQQSLEVERINNYIRGYVFDTASVNR